MKESQKAAQKRYAQKMKVLYVRLNTETETDMIAHIDKVPNQSQYIKDLIRQDMEK